MIANLIEKFSLASKPAIFKLGLWGLGVLFGGRNTPVESIYKSSINPSPKVSPSKHLKSCWFFLAIFFFPFSNSSFAHITKQKQTSYFSAICLWFSALGCKTLQDPKQTAVLKYPQDYRCWEGERLSWLRNKCFQESGKSFHFFAQNNIGGGPNQVVRQ